MMSAALAVLVPVLAWAFDAAMYAWLTLSSSQLNTRAGSGGSRYGPTTSSSFSTNRLSLESLNDLTRCGLSPCSCHTRRTVEALTPAARAIVLVDHCVALGGVVCVVRSMIARTLAGVRAERCRPPRGASLANPATPSVRNRLRHRETAWRRTLTCAAICLS